MSKRPKISIIIPSYNYGRYLKFCINSILSQSFKDFEIILINDGSTDNTVKVARSFKDKRIKFFDHKKNLGCIKRLNEGLRKVRGEYINILSADDGTLPKNFEKKVDILEKNPGVGLVFSEARVIDKNGKFIKDTNFRGSESYINKDDYYALLSYGSFIHTGSMLARASCYKKIGFFDEEIPLGAEHYIHLKMCKHFKTAYINKPLVFFRAHGENWSGLMMDTKSLEKDLTKAINKHFEKNPSSRKLKALAYGSLYYPLFRRYFSKRNFVKAFLFLIKSLQASQSYFFYHLKKRLKS